MITNIQNKKIAVVANMSAGKSSFLNALFGDSVLPAYSHATTDCPVYIYSDDNPDNDMAIIEFLDDKPAITLEKDKVKKELNFYAQKDNDEIDQKYKNVKKIDLYWDFHVLQNSHKYSTNFVIIDTPGPNNTDHHAIKHSDTTKDIILNEADMLLYIFDYGQIDANLNATNDNIWGFIQKRKEKDPCFEVLFIVNKIDKAIEDNKNLPEIKMASSEKEYYNKLASNWMYYEKIAINKIKNSAKKFGFKNPRVFGISSIYVEYNRNKNNLGFFQKKEFDNFIQYFQSVFNDKWNSKFHEYLGYRKIESTLTKHLTKNSKKSLFIKKSKRKIKKRK